MAFIDHRATSRQEPETRRYVLDWERLPAQFPTHRHTTQFWECLGRTVATFGFLEEVLGKAIFAFTAIRRYGSMKEAEAAYEAWLPELQQALSDPLWNLAEKYRKAVLNNPDTTISNVDELVEDIKASTRIRNVLCHGSWRAPDEAGKALPLFINKNNEKFETRIDIEYLVAVQRHVAELSCVVIESVTRMGWQFPGGTGLGKTIWP